MTTEEVLDIELHGHTIGTLERRGSASLFRPTESWMQDNYLPRLGLTWSSGAAVRHANTGVPEWFENLLPEAGGTLRTRLSRIYGIKNESSFALLAHLGVDLPGAVIVRRRGEIIGDDDVVAGPNPTAARFSLAGFQLKYSMSLVKGRLTMPAVDEDGQYILKIATLDLPDLADVEHATMAWARLAGFEVPETRVVPLHEIDSLSELIPHYAPKAFVIRRYDRQPGGVRLHQEDFAQIYDVMPQHKYSDGGTRVASHDGMARIIRDACSDESAIEYVKRLVFVIASGNSDAHLKNWSLLVPPDGKLSLTPLYDQVASVFWAERFGWATTPPKLALGLGGRRTFHDLTISRFFPIAHRLGWDEAEMKRLVNTTCDALRDAWTTTNASDDLKKAVYDHWTHVPLLR